MKFVKINAWMIICLLMATPLVVGILTFHAYGESIDESGLRAYSDYSLNAYRGILGGDFNPDLGQANYRYYGPASLMAENLFVKFLYFVTNKEIGPDAWHLANFLSFYLCAIELYLLAKRWLTKFTALSVSLLFLFQPLLWGQAFINPKDIPFMAFFLASILIGLHMRDKLIPMTSTWDFQPYARMKQGWLESRSSDRKLAILFLFFTLTLPAIFLAGRNWIVGIISGWIKIIYSANADSLISRVFAFFAKNYRVTPAESYAFKSSSIMFIFLEIIVAFFALLFLGKIFRNILPRVSMGPLFQLFKDMLNYMGNPTVLFSGLILGLTISIRVLGPLAGAIVLVTFLNKPKQRAWPILLAYFIVAALVAYFSWPYLWLDPIGRFKTSLIIMSNYLWLGKTLFNGAYYLSNQLPWNYIPLLFGIQFTEPVVLLFVIGLGIFIFQIWKRRTNFDFAVIVLLCGIVPLVGFSIFRFSLYDNFRQLLFIVPPLFLLVGLAVEKVFQRLRNIYWRMLIMVLLLFPGIYSIIRLHPYQYVYYNSFVGGVRGAYRRFESDYLATSSREAMEYINGVAPENAHVIVYTAGADADMVVGFARSDLIVDFFNDPHFNSKTGYEYAILSTRNDRDLKYFSNWQIVFRVERESNVFVVVKKRP